MVRFTLKQCAYLLAVVEHGGIAQAARALNISQPAVSQAIDKLEALYGFQLLFRHHARGTELTPEGRSFASHARALISNAETVEFKARSIAANLAGTIRFACFHTIAPFYLAHIITSYRAKYPHVNIIPSELLQDDIVAALISEELDLALTYDMGLEGRNLETITAAHLTPVILLSADHPLAAQRSISLADMAEEPFVMFEGPASGDYFRSALKTHALDPTIAFNATTMESVRCAVANGLGFSISVMRPHHDETYDGGRVVSVPISEDVEPIPLVLAFKKHQTSSGLIDNFAQFCVARTASKDGDELPVC